MTFAVVVATVAAVGVAVYATQPPKPNPEHVQLKTAADRGANSHYVYAQGQWHHPSDNLPWGQRAGAESYPFAKEASEHFEIPYKSSAGYYSKTSLWAYNKVHSTNEEVWEGGRKTLHSYNGEGYLPPGTWTGAPLADYHESQTVTWRQDAQGRVRPYEISGQAVNLNAPAAQPVAPAPKNP
jgi:hypothetical protein